VDRRTVWLIAAYRLRTSGATFLRTLGAPRLRTTPRARAFQPFGERSGSRRNLAPPNGPHSSLEASGLANKELLGSDFQDLALDLVELNKSAGLANNSSSQVLMMATARPAAEALVMGSRTMLAIAGQAFGCDSTVLLDSCAEVSLIGRQFIRELSALR